MHKVNKLKYTIVLRAKSSGHMELIQVSVFHITVVKMEIMIMTAIAYLAPVAPGMKMVVAVQVAIAITR